MDWLFILNEQPQLIELSYTANRGISRKGKKCKTVFKDFPLVVEHSLRYCCIILYIDTEPSSKTVYRFQKISHIRALLS